MFSDSSNKNVRQPFSDSPEKAATALRSVVRILTLWGATMAQGEKILRVSHSTYARAKKGEEFTAVILDTDQLTRLSYVANIHAALRTLFSNPKNQYRFMRMENHNVFFRGKAPLTLISSGDFGALHETFKHIDGLQGGL